jgi:molecular chaperone IbpA
MNTLVTTSNFPKEVGDLFNQFFNGPDTFHSRQEGYPPYNAWAYPNGPLKIEIAVAGFSIDELTVEFDGRTLSIIGEKKESTSDDDEGKQWLYRGLAKRKFVRQFEVRGSFSIESAFLKNGVLTITLKNENRKSVIEVREE